MQSFLKQLFYLLIEHGGKAANKEECYLLMRTNVVLNGWIREAHIMFSYTMRLHISFQMKRVSWECVPHS